MKASIKLFRKFFETINKIKMIQPREGTNSADYNWCRLFSVHVLSIVKLRLNDLSPVYTAQTNLGG